MHTHILSTNHKTHTRAYVYRFTRPTPYINFSKPFAYTTYNMHKQIKKIHGKTDRKPKVFADGTKP